MMIRLDLIIPGESKLGLDYFRSKDYTSTYFSLRSLWDPSPTITTSTSLTSPDFPSTSVASCTSRFPSTFGTAVRASTTVIIRRDRLLRPSRIHLLPRRFLRLLLLHLLLIVLVKGFNQIQIPSVLNIQIRTHQFTQHIPNAVNAL